MSAAAEQYAAPGWSLSVRSRASDDWDRFVASRPSAPVYLLSGWTELASEVFGHRAVFIEARNRNGVLEGVLPVMQQKSLLVGNFATSIPFFNYGGAECDSDELAHLLMSRARDIAREWGCSYLEFRDSKPRPGDWNERKDKVSMVLPLPESFDLLSKQLGSKLRSQVKRTDRENPSVRIGGSELVNDFYDVFAENMRDLGTPVYPKRFFEAIVRRFPELCRLLVVDAAGKPAAAGLLVIYKGRAEIPWAACRASAKPLGFNMKLYWEVLRLVVELGCTHFDFGRSTVDAGTYKFKKQWGAQPVQLHWHRWEKSPAKSPNPESKGPSLMERASMLWQKLPLPLANAIGPWLSPKLPW